MYPTCGYNMSVCVGLVAQFADAFEFTEVSQPLTSLLRSAI